MTLSKRVQLVLTPTRLAALRWCSVVAVTLIGMGCGTSSVDSPDSGPSAMSVTGAIADHPFVLSSAVLRDQNGKGFNVPGIQTYVELTDYAGACEDETRNCCPAVGQRLILMLAQTDANGQGSPPVDTGDYMISSASTVPTSSKVGGAYYEGGCGKVNAHHGDGSVTVTRIDRAAGVLEGHLDLTLSCGGFSDCTPDPIPPRFTGNFQAVSCTGLDVNRSPAACK